MITFDNQFTPSSFSTYEQFKSNITDINLIRWADRFIYKYSLSCSYTEIEVQGFNRIFSQYSTLFGVVLAYQAFDDIAELSFANGIFSTKPSHFKSSNDLLHEAIVNNKKLCNYLLKSSEKSDDAFQLLHDSINLKEKNVVIFSYFIQKCFLNQDFTAKNVGVSQAIDKENIINLKNYINAISNNMFTTFVKTIAKK